MKPLQAKKQVKVFLENRGLPFDNEDVMDAFVVAYHQYYNLGTGGGRVSFTPLDDSEVLRPVRAKRK